MIRATDIYKSYGEVRVLNGVNLSIDEGEIVSIVGASGAGKSTLLQIIGTLDKPDSGQVAFDKRDVFSLNDKQLSSFRNKSIGFIFQFHHLLPEFTAIENVCIPGFIAKRSKDELEKEAKRLLDFLGLSHRYNHKPSELSGGEQQRVAVARALINKPGIVLADEPSGNLDSKNAKELHQLFFDLRDEFGQSFLIVTHNEELAQLSNRRLVMQDGRIV